jgi:hypothetical protein
LARKEIFESFIKLNEIIFFLSDLNLSFEKRHGICLFSNTDPTVSSWHYFRKPWRKIY